MDGMTFSMGHASDFEGRIEKASEAVLRGWGKAKGSVEGIAATEAAARFPPKGSQVSSNAQKSINRSVPICFP